jgi:hypothetical protein
VFRARAIGLSLLLLGCAAQPPQGDQGYCAQLFDQLDVIERTAFVPSPLGAPDLRQMQLARIRQAGCLTFSRDLAGLDAAAAAAPGRAAVPAAGWSGAVQAGVVTNMADDARALAFFEGIGYRARSVGWPGLGRRILVEARTPAEAQEIIAVARQGGFVGPYLTRYVTF